MFKAIELQNFKAFGQRSRIEFAPITLIYGQNSAGKSSILNALNLLKQTRMSRDHSALLLPRAEGGLVDLGSFHELLHDHDSARTLMIRVDLETNRQPASRQTAQTPLELGFEVGFRREHNQDDIDLAFLKVYSGKDLGLQTEAAVQFVPRVLSEEELKESGRYPGLMFWPGSGNISHRDLKAASCTRVTESEQFWSAPYNSAREHSKDILKSIKTIQGSTWAKDILSVEALSEAIVFYQRAFTMGEFIERQRRTALGSSVLLDGFVPLSLGPSSAANSPESVSTRVFFDEHRQWTVFNAATLALQAGQTLGQDLDQLFPLGPYRRPPKRLYIFTGTTPTNVGYSGDLLPDLLFRRRNLVRETNEWLDRLDIGYHIEISPVGTPSNDLFEVRLRDTRRSTITSIALPDVGFGISQILPFIVQTLASENQTITIEQPEVHIHPRLQADLADLLIAGVQQGRNHRFVVETHSEHLILRLLRRIRETTEGVHSDQNPGLTPSQISVVYLERGKAGVQVHHLRVNEQGEFVDRWPEGFFEERAKELF